MISCLFQLLFTVSPVVKCRRSKILTPTSLLPKKSLHSRSRLKKSDAIEGLKLNNRSLIIFDEVDVLFDSDRGFWSAVGKLLQIGRRPIFLTASDPSILRLIPVPFQTLHLLPLKSPVSDSLSSGHIACRKYI